MNENLFSDAQVERIRQLIQDEGNIQLGKAVWKVILLAVGSLVTGAIAGILAYLGTRH